MKFSPTGRPVFTGTLKNFEVQSVNAALMMSALIKSVEDKLISQGLIKVAEGSDWSEWAGQVDLSSLELRMLAANPELAFDPYLQLSPPVAADPLNMNVANSDGTSREK